MPKHSNPNLLPIGETFGFVVLFFVVIMSIFGFAYCSRLLLFMTMVTTIAELMYLGIVDDSSGKDTLLTKICVSAITGLILVTGICFRYFSFILSNL